MMMPWGMFGGAGGGVGMILGLLVWVVLIVGAILLVRWLVEQGRREVPPPREESAVEILKKRYARGEIDRQEFETRMRDLL